MTILQAIILGIFQGVAEFLPISSSGHLLVFKDIMGLSDVPVLFDITLHLATLVSIVIVFRKRIIGIVVSIARWIGRKSAERDAENLAIVIPAIIATAVTAVLGYFVNKIDLNGQPKIVAGLLIVTAFILIGSSFFKGQTRYSGLRWHHGLITGLAQGIGVFPGISRSGITIGGGLASGMDRETAGEFAFLLAIPAILGALIMKIGDLGDLSASVAPLPMALAALFSCVVGILSLRILMPIVRKGKLAWFAVYLIPAGILGLVFL